ncbi:MAG: hypothetical protein IJ220_04300 [Clostridia bacterium]|nr:hypothetical protein [Clostridia bacterium]
MSRPGIAVQKISYTLDNLFYEKNGAELEKLRAKLATFARAKELIDIYQKFLTSDLVLTANTLTWESNTPEEYEEYFLSNVLMKTYRPFDKTHSNYFRVLKTIQEHNPEWEKSFVRRHDEWVKMLKDRKVHIYTGSQ